MAKQKKKTEKQTTDIPYWVAAGYTALEWEQRKRFEMIGSDQEKFSRYVSDLSELEL